MEANETIFWKVRVKCKTSIPRDSVVFRKSSLANFSPLSTRTFCGEPYTATHIQKNSFMIASLHFSGIKVAADRRVQRSILCKIRQPSYCFRSIAINSWNCKDIQRDVHGLSGGLLYFLQISQLFVTFFISLCRLLFSDHSFPALAISFMGFSINGCAKEQCSFIAISLICIWQVVEQFCVDYCCYWICS